MSFWRHFMGDYGQTLDISDAQSDIAGLRKAIEAKESLDRRQDQEVEALQRRLFELEQGLSALMKRLVEKNVLTPADLQDFARTFAAADRDES